MRKNHLLIVDDDYRIRSLLSQYLSNNGYLITSVADSKEARKALETFQFDLIILDVLLPQELGTEFAISLRKVSHIAILMLTAMGTPEERIKGLEAGADDYMAKPFDPKELLLRIEKLLARTKHHLYKSNNYVDFGQVKYDKAKNALIQNEELIPLSISEIKLLTTLLQKKGKVIDRKTLAETLNINPRSIDVQIKRLRNKIETNPAKPTLLQTIRGQGYALFMD
jgi:two-component system phosphate regulon response regulator OmpR